jgi:hypothetical protein
MRKIIFAIIVILLFVGCNQKREHRRFFTYSKGFPDFKYSNGKLPVFGFDSLIIDSLSTLINGKDYWYLNTASNALLNINGYIRSNEKVVYIIPGEKDENKANKEQVLLDFSCDTVKSWNVKYQRNGIIQYLRISVNGCFYNQLIKDSAVIFKVYKEKESTSFSEDFLMQVSLQKGIVSFIYFVRPQKKIYTIDYLPTARVRFDTVSSTLYQVQ